LAQSPRPVQQPLGPRTCSARAAPLASLRAPVRSTGSPAVSGLLRQRNSRECCAWAYPAPPSTALPTDLRWDCGPAHPPRFVPHLCCWDWATHGGPLSHWARAARPPASRRTRAACSLATAAASTAATHCLKWPPPPELPRKPLVACLPPPLHAQPLRSLSRPGAAQVPFQSRPTQ